MKLLMTIPLLFICSSANAIPCIEDCYWVSDEPTIQREWINEVTVFSGFTTEKVTSDIMPEKSSGANDSYICYRLQNGLESYGDYTVAKESPTSENVSLYKNGILQRECNFIYYPIYSSKKHKKITIPWQVSIGNSYWKYTTIENGYWECTTTETVPTPDPATALLFGIGLLTLTRKKK